MMRWKAALEGAEDDVDDEQRQQQQRELNRLVNTELLKLDQDEVDRLVATTKEKYPYWEPNDGTQTFEGFAVFDDAIARFESDGTFGSSLKTRFRMLDFVWLTLGMISAFAIAFTLGQSGKRTTKEKLNE